MKAFFDFLKTTKGQHIAYLSLLFVLLLGCFFPVAVLRYVPQAHDNIQYKGVANVSKEYEKENGEKALWNSNVFSGMPNYMIALSKSVPFISDLRKITNPIVNWRIFLLFTAGVGMYLLLLSLGFSPFIAFIGSMAFAFSPHFIGLIQIGHNTKFRAVMYIPWILWAFRRVRIRPSFFTFGVAAAMLIGQLQENHPQITYYTMIVLGIYWATELFYAIREKETKSFVTFSILLLLIGGLTIISVADPYFYDMEYGHYTIRGGSTGLTTDYATSWSFHPAEILTFIFPGMFGNVSPIYWGWMPFTQVSNYFGVVLFMLAIFGLFQWKKNRMIPFLGISVLVTLLFSFGRHFPLLSNFLLAYFPMFNKFRVPAMILILTIFLMILLAMYGLKFILENAEDETFKKRMKYFLFASIGLFFVGLVSQGMWAGLSFTKASEVGRYAANQLTQLRAMRFDVFMNSMLLSLAFIAGVAGLFYAFVNKKMKASTMLFLLAILIFGDIYSAGRIHLKKDELVKEKRLNTTFAKSSIDDFLLADKELHRIYPLGQDFGNNNWAYYHQTIGGYHAAKLKRYQEIIEHCLNAEIDYKVPINWNILNMLNAKYLLFEQNLPFDHLKFVHFDKRKNIKAYENLNVLPRAWFVDSIEVHSESKKIWNRLNTKEFNPRKTALVEKPITGILTPDSTAVQIIKHDLHEISLETYNDKSAFLVLSEVYYPAGWNAYIDGKQTDIYASNYILRGIKVPKGNHTITFKFEPKTYFLSKTLSIFGILITLLLIGVGGFLEWKRKQKGEREYVVV